MCRRERQLLRPRLSLLQLLQVAQGQCVKNLNMGAIAGLASGATPLQRLTCVVVKIGCPIEKNDIVCFLALSS